MSPSTHTSLLAGTLHALPAIGGLLIAGALVAQGARAGVLEHVVGIVAGLGVLVAAFGSPSAAAGIFLFGIAANGLTVEINSIVVRPEMFSVVMLPFVLHHFRQRDRSQGGIAPWAWIATGCWATIATFSALYRAPIPYASYWVTLQMLLGMLVLWTIRLTNTSKILDLYGKILTAVAGVSVASWLLIQSGVTSNGLGVADDGRTIGLSFEPNIFAAQCVGWLGVLYFHSARLPAWAKFQVPVLVLAIALSGTRAAWIAGGVLCAVVVGSMTAAKSKWLVVYVGMLVVAITTLFILVQGDVSSERYSLLWRLSHLFDVSQGTGAYRFEIYRQAIFDISSNDRWLFGSGSNSFSQFHHLDSTGRVTPYLSSVWVATIYDVGIIGTAMFAGVIGAAVADSDRRFSALVVVVVLLVCASLTNVLWFQFSWLYFALARTNDAATETLTERQRESPATPSLGRSTQ